MGLKHTKCYDSQATDFFLFEKSPCFSKKPSQLKLENLRFCKKTEEMEENNMKAKAMDKATLTLGLMIIVTLFLTSCSGVVTPELQLESEEDMGKVEVVEEVNEEQIEEAIEEIVEEIIETTGSAYLNVPYEKYAGTNWCLPASGAMTFKYFGMDISQSQIASSVITNGTSSVYKMVKYAKELGFEAKYNYMTLEEVKNLLTNDIPVIAVQNYTLSLPFSHARVIIGFDDEKQEIISNDPTAGKDYKMSYSNFAALNTGINPDLFKIIVIAVEDISIKNAELINNMNNS